jgi:hypothetical protein
LLVKIAESIVFIGQALFLWIKLEITGDAIRKY